MSDTPTRFPLVWPMGRPRRPLHDRKPGKFTYRGDDGWQKDITVPRAMDRLEEEIRRIGGTNMLLSTNVDTRLDGRPRGGAGEPSDPGVCLYFSLKGKPMSMPCDAYSRVAQNIAALAAHIEATRAIERHGVATGAETLQAFQALPAPTPTLPGNKPWREVLCFPDGWPAGYSDSPIDDLNRRYRAKMIEAHESERVDLNVARDAALKELS